MDSKMKNACLALKGGFLNLKGRSMEPVLREGDVIKVEPINTPDIKIGNIVVFFDARKEKPVCHRIIGGCEIKGEKFFLEKGDNSNQIGVVSEYDILGRLSYVLDNNKPRLVEQDYNANKYSVCLFSRLIIVYKKISEPIKQKLFSGKRNRFSSYCGKIIWRSCSLMAGLILKKNPTSDKIIDSRLFKKEAKLLLTVLNPEKENRVNDIEGADWELFCKIAYCQAISEYIYINLPELYTGVIPARMLEYMRNTYYASIVENERLWKEFKTVAGLFQKNNIVFVPFKGVVFNNFIYSDTYARRMQDIDIMIKKDNAMGIKNILSELGYSPARDMKSLDTGDHFMEFVKHGKEGRVDYVLDVQWGDTASFIDANKNGLPDMWDRIRFVEKDGVKIPLLSPEDMLFNLFFHQRRLGVPFNLRNILDISCIIRKYQNDIDWDFIIRSSRENRIKALVFFCLCLSKELFGCDCPSVVLKSLMPGIIKRKLFSCFFRKTLCYTGTDTGREIKVPYFIPIVTLLYDRVSDLFIYTNRISRRQFARFCGIKRDTMLCNILYNFKLISLPMVLLFKKCFKSTKT